MALHVRMDIPPYPPFLEAAAEGLVLLNVALMQYAEDGGVQVPALYESGVVYRREPPGREWWETALDLLSVASHRSGDCEDLAAYRAAELRHTGEDPGARVAIVETPRGSYHAIVEHGDGSYEDPSRVVLAIETAHPNRRGIHRR